MRVGIIGSGDVGRALGIGFVQSGHETKIGTRHPEEAKLQAWKSSQGAKASIGSFAEAAQFGDVVVLATRGSVAIDAVRLAGVDHFSGKTVLDVTNPLDFLPNAPPGLFVGHTDSLGEQVQRALPKAHVVKVFNIVGNSKMFRPKFESGTPDMFIAGNDAASKAKVAKILHEFGWSSVDIGGIDGARVLEPLCLLWVKSAMALGNFEVAFKLLQK